MVEAVLNIFAAFRLVWFAREGEPEGYRAQRFPFLEKVGVQEVAFGCVAAKEEKRGSQSTTGGNLSSTLLDEATEGSETCN
jgi:hypothetical protein